MLVLNAEGLQLPKQEQEKIISQKGINPTLTHSLANFQKPILYPISSDISMSRHRSYGRSSGSAKKRNVLKRFERVDVLRKLGRWKDGENKKVTGLPKTPAVS